MHILVVGATSPMGLTFCQRALDQYHVLTLYSQNPTRLPGEIGSHENVHVVVEGTPDKHDFRALEKAVHSCGATVFVAFNDPDSKSKGTAAFKEDMKIIFPLLAESHYERALVHSSYAYVAPEDHNSLKWGALRTFSRIMDSKSSKESADLGSWIAAQPTSGVGWTLVRAPFLSNRKKEIKGISAGFVGSGRDGMFLSRSGLVDWILEELGKRSRESDWVGKAPLVSH